MHFLSLLLLCLAPNLDNMAIGLAYGARKISVPPKSNLAIALFSGFAIFISSLCGSLLANYIPSYLGNIIGGSIVSIMGIYTILSYLHTEIKKKRVLENSHIYMGSIRAVMSDPVIADKDYSGDISLKESILLGIALALNCLGTGFGAGMAGVNIYILTAAVIVFSFFTISFGAFIGRRYAAQLLGDRATLLSGLILLSVGTYQIFL
ncbi:putative sporulation protein YtaF [Ruminiclostridium sufflavum DSM 19573]|uniref:Putative sporulation protein YtaF n=1 Tax=Ruminiclostridium sufflavum DSM 19573 TaxID=1121337 RepID=A0A318XJC2_9FIRM|nr:sporulation membrane protein YtaF [Ruminiclostridium sufflavum]PYG85818.1 putative sporulation protein YtaF [Ruminiclostridium sufflavum DSM 19573]